MSDNLPAVTSEDQKVKYVPFGARDEIELSVRIVQRWVATKSKSKNVPDKDDCVRFIMLCKSRHLNPFEGDAYFLGYDGREGTTWSLITAHQAFLKRAENNPEFDGMESGVLCFKKGKPQDLIERQGDFLFDDEILAGGWARVFFKHRTHPIYRKVNLRTFKKPFGRWNDDPAGMIVKCAEADALRSSFPTLLGGCYTEEELPAPAGATPQASRSKLTKAAPAVPDPEPEPPRAPTLQELVARGEAQAAGEEHASDESEQVDEPVAEPIGDLVEYPSRDELANYIESLGCKDPDTCLSWSESTLDLYAEGAIEDPYEYLKAKPWDDKPKKGKPKTQQSMIPESEIPF